MRCLLVINTLSGRSAEVKEQEVIRRYAAEDDVTVRYLHSSDENYALGNNEKLIVCGGDGTLHRAIERFGDLDVDIYYLPCGTFNETAKALKGKGIIPLPPFASIGGTPFAYVAATGSFTELGRLANANAKHRFKLFAYFAKVIAAYKVHRTQLTIRTPHLSQEGAYTLLMISDAPRCFGFRFNRLHKKHPTEVQLLAIKAPERDSLWGRIRIFFPFFRAFFLGFSKPYLSKNILFTSVSSALITLSSPAEFCLDGESAMLDGAMKVERHAQKARVFVIKE